MAGGVQVIYMNEESGITTSYYQFLIDRGISFEEAMRIYAKEVGVPGAPPRPRARCGRCCNCNPCLAQEVEERVHR